MRLGKSIKTNVTFLVIFFICLNFLANSTTAQENFSTKPGNFGLPGIIDLPTAKRFPDGELIVTQQLHKSLARTGISFQALPRLGVSFRYTGHGVGGREAYGRVNHDRSFDAHLAITDEGKYLPAISIGLRDFIGTGWYSSEYIVGTKSIGNIQLTAGLGFGRLAGRNSFSNPFGGLSSKFYVRDKKVVGWGTLGTITWFQGDASAFYGLRYKIGKKITISSEYTPDLMSTERAYLNVESPFNWGISYQLNNYVHLSTQYLHGNQLSVTAHLTLNPNRPPLLGGKELAPVPMRLRGKSGLKVKNNNEVVIRKVLATDKFEIHSLNFTNNTVKISLTNTKFRSTAQAIGRVASTLQRFTADNVRFAQISFYSQGLQTATFQVDLEQATREQFNPKLEAPKGSSSIKAIYAETLPFEKLEQRFTWGLGPYFTNRLFNPHLPISFEAGIEVEAGYKVTSGLTVSGSLRKSILTNITDNVIGSGSALPAVQSEWPLYDAAGQNGHIHTFTLSYLSNLGPGLYARAHAGLLEPFFAGLGGEILYKPAQSPLGIGIDLHRVRKRDYNMRFELLDYETTVGHISLYYDAGGMFKIELNAGRYLAGDWGATTTISRKFGSGWEVGGYATLTDVPFDTFGEGSFDKAIFISMPIDWLISSPSRSKRRLMLRPITRDGGANLASARRLYRTIERTQNAQFIREFGRLWR